MFKSVTFPAHLGLLSGYTRQQERAFMINSRSLLTEEFHSGMDDICCPAVVYKGHYFTHNSYRKSVFSNHVTYQRQVIYGLN